jgi:hypothetical protein
MASTYFLNAQPGQISITLNSGPATVLAGLNDPNNDPFCKLGLRASPDKNVLGTGGVNSLAVNTTDGHTEWKITLRGILPGNDIQFLVFANQVLGRQGIQTHGFEIVQTAGSKRRKPVTKR